MNRVKGKIPLFAAKLVLFILGLVVLAMGAVSMMKAALGASSWDVLHIGLSGLSGLSVGIWVQIVGILMIGIACILDRRLPKIGSIANIVLIGFFVNIFLASSIIPSVSAQWARFAELVAGIVLMGVGSGMYVASGLGAGPRDGITLTLVRLTGKSVRLVRTCLEGTALFLGWIAGGPISFGTFLSVFLVGPVMQASLRFWTAQVRRWERSLLPVIAVERPEQTSQLAEKVS
ncbi:membrane protein [Brevibacillus borstelensis]|uniref:YczE/YyaS/YitT family protein n=1 Tax=Brevibacillus borstelensis TaxID=45462 RepID=UPI0030C23792